MSHHPQTIALALNRPVIGGLAALSIYVVLTIAAVWRIAATMPLEP